MKDAKFFKSLIGTTDAVKAQMVEASDGVMVRIVSRAVDHSHGTVFVLPGRTGYAESNWHFIELLAEHMFSSVSIDPRGQGLSQRFGRDHKVGHIENYMDYQKDIAAALEYASELEMPRPWFLLGISSGACIGLRAIHETKSLTAAAFVCPMWEIKLPAYIKHLAKFISWTAIQLDLGDRLVPGESRDSYYERIPFEGNEMTSDPVLFEKARLQAISEPEVQLGGPSLNWLYQTFLECSYLQSFGTSELPIRALLSGKDTIVDNTVVHKILDGYPNAQIQMFNGKHDMLSEVPNIRNIISSNICDFFKAVTKRPD